MVIEHDNEKGLSRLERALQGSSFVPSSRFMSTSNNVESGAQPHLQASGLNLIMLQHWIQGSDHAHQS